jgi:hypothetical protein
MAYELASEMPNRVNPLAESAIASDGEQARDNLIFWLSGSAEPFGSYQMAK